MQILTKRPGPMRRYVVHRYGNSGVPANIWFGVTCEDNRVKRSLDLLRDLKDRVGEFTAFASIEPITAPCDEIDLAGIDWVLTGGESGPKARPMNFEWVEQANEKALAAGSRCTSRNGVTRATTRWCSRSWTRAASQLDPRPTDRSRKRPGARSDRGGRRDVQGPRLSREAETLAPAQGRVELAAMERAVIRPTSSGGGPSNDDAA